ncbi:MAG: acyl-ACP--UDP-N-acetylglucosamine O-acyltransferase [Cardiobacteriaceae bacterium]|nr:acyl-ACP--UDP-N-acetylglucosamine O-acyltransferase [Cardiobacteriaceae bacterium]
MIHPTAIIDPKAELADDVSIGAYSVIGAGVQIDRGTTVAPHVVIEGPTRIGKNNHIFPFASLGAIPQDKKYNGEETTLEIGDNNTIREFVTFNRGTVQDIGKTVVGDGNWIMAYIHIAHDCVIGNHTTMANNVTFAGHVRVDDHVVMGGFALVYQFVHIGAYSMIGYCAGVKQNVPPYSLVVESPARIAGINLEGLKRHQFSAEDIASIKKCHRHLYQENLLLEEARHKINALASESDPARKIAAFLEHTGKRGLIR